jgi:hypothetical protein
MTTQTIGRQTTEACATGTLEKTLRLIAGIVVTTSVLLGLYVHPNWFYLTLFAGLNLFQSGLTNWCPMMTILRRAGLR